MDGQFCFVYLRLVLYKDEIIIGAVEWPKTWPILKTNVSVQIGKSQIKLDWSILIGTPCIT